ncbi:MAG: His/Gly/Thr/Pro-type tRNA ligase C-terminal domain-containing protein, partial [Nitrospinota bacterium]|nr:His/Gly/Thr/Pro-type tRNA ligase C-terminal domain-containing protein [Nitrospinota bacterium]
PSPKNDGGVLRQTKGIEIGHVFKLGTKYTEALGAFVLDEHNQRQPLVMGCYGIGVNRILAAAIEREGGHDKDGIIWPLSIAPYSVLITPLALEGQAVQVTDRLAMEIEAAGHDVLIDDRPERPGVKFKDADLIGVPLRITIGEKGLKDGKVELKPRQAPRAELIGVDQ